MRLWRNRRRPRPRLVVNLRDIVTPGYRAYIQGLRRRGSDVRVCWDAVLQIIWEYENRLFDNEGQTPEHARWTELSDRPIRFHRDEAGNWLGYRSYKQRYHPGTKIGELSGKLRAQLTGEEPAYELREAQRLTFGTDYTTFAGVPGRPRSPLDRTAGNDLGGMHMEGRRNYYPYDARPPIRVTRPEVNAITDVLLDYVLQGREP